MGDSATSFSPASDVGGDTSDISGSGSTGAEAAGTGTGTGIGAGRCSSSPLFAGAGYGSGPSAGGDCTGFAGANCRE